MTAPSAPAQARGRWVEDQPFADYQKEAGLNWSLLKLAITSAAHYSAGRVGQTRPVKSAPLFSAVHKAVLENDVYDDEYRVWPGRRAGKDYEAACAALPGCVWLTEAEQAQVEAIRAAVSAHEAAADLLRGLSSDGRRLKGGAEVSLYWSEGGRKMKGRIDRLVRRVDADGKAGHWDLIDLKGMPSISPRRAASEIARRHYHGQLAHYAAGIRACEPPGRHLPIRCWIVGYEQGPIVDVAVYDLGTIEADGVAQGGAIYAGQSLRAEALAVVAAIEAGGPALGQCPRPVTVELPTWAYGDGEDDTASQWED